MNVAKLINNQIFIDKITNFYPAVAFPTEGITDEIIEMFDVYKVIETLQCSNLQKVVTIDPILKDGTVYTVEILNKTQEEIDTEKFAEIREYRNQKLNVSDNYVMSDRWDQYTEEKRSEWRIYRQTLRDLPQIYANNIHSVVYPQMPT